MTILIMAILMKIMANNNGKIIMKKIMTNEKNNNMKEK